MWAFIGTEYTRMAHPHLGQTGLQAESAGKRNQHCGQPRNVSPSLMSDKSKLCGMSLSSSMHDAINKAAEHPSRTPDSRLPDRGGGDVCIGWIHGGRYASRIPGRHITVHANPLRVRVSAYLIARSPALNARSLIRPISESRALFDMRDSRFTKDFISLRAAAPLAFANSTH